MSLPVPTSTTSARTIAALLSLAITDALGAPVEFKRRDTFPPVTTFLPTPHFNLPAGTPTDDTSMALCLATALLDARTSSPTSQAALYIRWYRHGYLSATGHCFDIGNCTRHALNIWMRGDEKGMEVYKAEDGSEWNWFEDQAGNGGLMRVLPVALVAWRDARKARQWAAESSRVTHPTVMSRLACEVYVDLVASILRDEFRDPETGKMEKRLLVEKLEAWEGWEKNAAGEPRSELEMRGAKQLRAAMKDVAKLRRDQVSSSGYVLHTLQAAVWAFLVSEGFVEGARLVVNLGDDADTVGAVYGGLAGAWYGGIGEGEKAGWWENEVVKDWREKLLMGQEIGNIAKKLADVDGKLGEE